jgi:hypothetical protein
MSPKIDTALRLDADLMAAMRKVKADEGIPVTTQIEKAVAAWLKRRGILVKKKTDRSREGTRKRS